MLFILTIVTTFFIGGMAYSAAIMAILFTHEMGHYFMSRKYGVPATLPYFIPMPFPPFGTLGAIIKMKGIIINKKALFDIGIAGPLSGFIVSIPFIIIGIKMSSIQFVTKEMIYFKLGDPLLFKILQKILIGDIPEGYDLALHPLAYAGWVGLFVTALNLLPIGQLDGGHIVYAIFGRKSKWIFGTSIVFLTALTIFYNPGWLLLVILLLIFGMRHPEPFDTETEIGGRRKFLAFVILLVFLLSFTLSPFPGLTKLNENVGIPL